MSDKFKGNVILLITAFIWGSGFIGQKIGMAYIGPFTFNGSRQIIAGLVLIPFALIEANKRRNADPAGRNSLESQRKLNNLMKGGLICGSLLFIATNLQQIGLTTVSAGKSGFITAIYIVLVPIVGVFMGERNTFKVWGSVILAMIGFAFLCLRGDSTGISVGDILTLGSAVFFAFQIVAVNNFVTRYNAIQLSAFQMVLSGILSCIVAMLLEHPTWIELLISAKPILYVALVPTAIGYTGQVVGQKYTSPTIASLLMSLESVFAVILGAIFLHEQMTAKELLGCAIIFAAVIIAQLPNSDPDEPQS